MCVTDAHAVEDVVFGNEGLAAAPGDGKLVVERRMRRNFPQSQN
jgi:3-hydroxyisobutyrate dehydrogenase